MSPMKLFAQFSIAAVAISILALAGLYIFGPKKSDQGYLSGDATKHISQAQFYDLNDKLQPLAQWRGTVTGGQQVMTEA